MRNIHKASVFGWLYAAGLLVGFHFFSIQYIHSSFLLDIMSPRDMGLLFSVSALLSVATLLSATHLFARFGAYHTTLVAATLDYLAMVGLATTDDTGLLVVCFALHTLLIPLILFSLDVFLENRATDESETGNVRGMYLSIGMIAALLSPVLAGFVAGTQRNYSDVYVVSSLFLLPFIAVLHAKFRTFSDPPYSQSSVFTTLTRICSDRDLFAVAMGQFLMRFYFSWMIVYLPIYLSGYVGFSWPNIGLILFLMLIPYLLVEWPAGLIADKFWGEKELLIIGFLITGVATVLLALPIGPSLFVWASILFVTRVGTALIESMTETYFFKKVGGRDTDLMSFFRILRPLAYVVGPISATVLLTLVPIPYLWLVLAGIMFCGVVSTAFLTDTR